jgi:uncharacterized protein (DUF2236 family)
MKEVASNQYYTIYVDKPKNRVYLTIKGFWKDREAVADYLEDVRRATHDETGDRYTILTDVREMKTPPQEVAQLHIEAQKVCVDGGLWKTAELLEKNIAAQMTLKRYSDTSGMQKRSFGNKTEAEAWLDEE